MCYRFVDTVLTCATGLLHCADVCYRFEKNVLTFAPGLQPPAPAPENVLVFEDAPSGVRAARAAEM